MFDEIIKNLLTESIWALLSFGLIVYILKWQKELDIKQNERERNYQKTILELTSKFNLIYEEIKKINLQK